MKLIHSHKRLMWKKMFQIRIEKVENKITDPVNRDDSDYFQRIGF